MSQKSALTKNQRLVLAVLNKSPSPISAYEILDQLRDEGIKAPLQVYRALAVLTERGICHRLESLNAFVTCSDANCAHEGMRGFIICNLCGKAEEFSDGNLHAQLDRIARDKKFVASHTMVEIKGTCSACTTEN